MRKIPPNLELNPIFGPARAHQQHPSLRRRRRRVLEKAEVCSTSMRLGRRRGGRGGKNVIGPQRSGGEEKGSLSSQRGNEMELLVEEGGSLVTALLVDHRPRVSLVVGAERARMGWLICREAGRGCWIDHRRE